MISTCDHQYSNNEFKSGQNKQHNQTNMWHYFKKTIQCNQLYFTVNIDVLEKNSRYYIYNTKLKEVDAPAISRSIISTSSIDNIPHTVSNVKQEEVGFVRKNETEAEVKVSLDSQVIDAKEKQKSGVEKVSTSRDDEMSL